MRKSYAKLFYVKFYPKTSFFSFFNQILLCLTKSTLKFRSVIAVLITLVVLGTVCDLGKIFLDWYEKNYVTMSLYGIGENEETSINSDEKLLLIKTYREKSKE
jgi:hypothetical protein